MKIAAQGDLVKNVVKQGEEFAERAVFTDFRREKK
jgi:hypothetical protein